MSRFTLLSAAALLTLAACSDSVSAPVPAEPPDTRRSAEPPDTRASADRIGGGIVVRDLSVTVKLHLRDQGYNDVAGATMEFTTNAGSTKLVADNGAGDADARPGHFSVQMPKAISYTATAKVLPDDISFDGASKTVSYFNSPTLVDMQVLALKIKPGLFITTYHQGAVVTGQTLKVSKGADFSVTITDGGPSDKDQWGNQSPADGKIFVRAPVTGNYKVCAVTAPAWGWGGCTEAWALQYFIAYSVKFEYKQEWVVVGLP